jgi:hypothetical protein
VKLLQAAALLAIVASPAIAQSTITPSTQNSGAGIPGQPGNKNGPAADAHGQAADQINPTTRLQDTSKIPGKPGSKSGPAAMPPSRSAQKP